MIPKKKYRGKTRKPESKLQIGDLILYSTKEVAKVKTVEGNVATTFDERKFNINILDKKVKEHRKSEWFEVVKRNK